jgi:multicomponent K+:H+ antiporter subunit E
MKTLLPAPGISAALFIAWLMLNGSLSAGPIVLGALLALAIPWSLRRMRPQTPVLARPEVALRLALVVARDIVVSGLGVGRRILGPEAAIRPRFVWLPLTIRDPHGIVALAGIVTMTPGTLSAEIAEDRSHLLIHAFDLDDEAALVADIRRRYEAPLRIVFGEVAA